MEAKPMNESTMNESPEAEVRRLRAQLAAETREADDYCAALDKTLRDLSSSTAARERAEGERDAAREALRHLLEAVEEEHYETDSGTQHGIGYYQCDALGCPYCGARAALGEGEGRNG